ncbi:MAG: GNAT family N-acetyltransferase [Burkholderiales bacterium]|nr:GNAT family N-acetyltransferase [Burkholderiales bacterium]
MPAIQLEKLGCTLKFRIFNRIDDVPADLWDGLIKGRSRTFSHAFWSLIEASKLNDFEYRYVVFYDEDDVAIGSATFYAVTTDIAIFAPRPLRSLLNTARRWIPNLLKLRMLECGTPIILNSPPWICATPSRAEEMRQCLIKLMERLASEEGCWLIIARDFEPGSELEQKEMATAGFHLIDGLPNTYLELPWHKVEDYQAAMKSYYRSKLQKYLKRNRAAGISHEVVDEFSELAPKLATQWLVVHEQAQEFQREILNTEFYRQLSLRQGISVKAVLYFRNNELVGHALLMLDGDLGRWLYFGREIAANDGLYLYVAYSVVQTAIECGVKRLELGLTTYPIKQDLGAHLTPIRFAIKASSKMLNPFVGWGYRLLNKPAQLSQRDVFRRLC